jgi:eukaryotic-like serine/threonine-protein kinase
MQAALPPISYRFAADANNRYKNPPAREQARTMGGDTPADQNSPTKVGKYDLRKVVGRGSIGVVYEGWDEVLQRIVAVKTLPLVELDTAFGQEKYQRFRREAQTAARLQHPNIAVTFDYGETSSLAYIVMEFIEGPSLRTLLEHTRVGIDQIRHIMDGLLAGLQHSHDQGVVHRDIKPANILFSKNGQIKITDFGIAHLEDSDLTQLGSQVGTPAYMSPEQVLGDPADARTDIYSAGVVLYEMLTGRRPFEGSTNSVMHKIVHSPPPMVSESTTAFTPTVDAVVAKVLAKDQKDRYQTASEFRDALDSSLQSVRVFTVPVAPEPEVDSTIVRGNARVMPEAAPATIPARRARVRRLTAAAVAASLALIGIIWWSVHKPAGRPAAPSSPIAGPERAASVVRQPLATAHGGPTQSAVIAPPTSAAKPPAELQSTGSNVRTGRSDLPAGLGTVAGRVPCSLVTVRIGDRNAVVVNGATALGETSWLEIQAIIRQSVAQLAPKAPVTWNVRRVDGPFCAIFDLLHPVAATTGPGLFVGVSGSGTDRSADKTTSGQVRAAMPGFAGTLILDAYSGDGMVHHLYPRSAAAPAFPAGTEVSVSLPEKAPDPRHNLLVAIASSTALLDPSRPADEPTAGYLKDLGDALARGRASGASVLADAAGIGADSTK